LAWRLAERALAGVGDATLGEWREIGSRTVHLRRRVSDAERASLGGLEVRDVRGTDEERQRIDNVFREVPELRGLM